MFGQESTGKFFSRRARNAQRVSISWRHHGDWWVTGVPCVCSWTVNLPDVSQDVRVWVTFASDCAIVVLYAFSYLQILPLIQLSCRYWEENFRITNTVSQQIGNMVI